MRSAPEKAAGRPAALAVNLAKRVNQERDLVGCMTDSSCDCRLDVGRCSQRSRHLDAGLNFFAHPSYSKRHCSQGAVFERQQFGFLSSGRSLERASNLDFVLSMLCFGV